MTAHQGLAHADAEILEIKRMDGSALIESPAGSKLRKIYLRAQAPLRCGLRRNLNAGFNFE